MKIKNVNRLKYAFYIREQALEAIKLIIKAVEEEGGSMSKSMSSNVSLIVNNYHQLSRDYFWLIEQVRRLYQHNIEQVNSASSTSRLQTYLDPEDARFIERYAKEITDGNVSHAINRIIIEYAGIIVTLKKENERITRSRQNLSNRTLT